MNINVDILRIPVRLSMMKAIITENEIEVRHTVRPDVGHEYLTIDCPNGWDDIKKICKKVLTFEGKKFTFTGWNSDRNECFFCKPINGECEIATIGKK